MTGREARNAYKRRWAQEHKEQVKAAQRKYWEKRAEQAEPGTTAADLKNAYQRNWAQKHPDRIKEHMRRYWDKKAAAQSEG